MAVGARLYWLYAVPPYGDSIRYWDWASAVLEGTPDSFSHAAHWTVSYPLVLCALSLGQTLGLGATAVVQAAVHALAVLPAVYILMLFGYRRLAVWGGTLAVAAAPYTSFADSRPLPDPLAGLLWWTGLCGCIALVGRREPRPAWWLALAAVAAPIGLAAHLRLNMLPAVGISCLCLLAMTLVATKRFRPTAGVAAVLLLATLPALLTAAIARRSGAAEYVENVTPIQAWSYTYFLGYDRWYSVVSSIPWKGNDPRPYLPAGWYEREDGPEVNALIEEALRGENPDRVAASLAEVGRRWREEHPVAYNVGLPALRLVTAWVPASPEVWNRFSAKRLTHYVERLLALLGLLVAGRIAYRRIKSGDAAPAVVVVSAFSLPVLTVLAMHAMGAEFSDYRAHQAGWMPMLAVGGAAAADAARRLASLVARRAARDEAPASVPGSLAAGVARPARRAGVEAPAANNASAGEGES